MEDLKQWDEVDATDVSTQTFDEAIQKLVAMKAEYAAKKKEADGAYADMKDAEGVVLELLAKSKKSKYFVDGVGTAYVINKYSVTTPKTVTEKEQLFKYIAEKYGKDTLDDYLSINSQRLNSFYNKEVELAQNEGRADFRLPGVGEPQLMQSLGFRKK